MTPIQILKPEINKLFALMDFHKEVRIHKIFPSMNWMAFCSNREFSYLYGLPQRSENFQDVPFREFSILLCWTSTKRMMLSRTCIPWKLLDWNLLQQGQAPLPRCKNFVQRDRNVSASSVFVPWMQAIIVIFSKEACKKFYSIFSCRPLNWTFSVSVSWHMMQNRKTFALWQEILFPPRNLTWQIYFHQMNFLKVLFAGNWDLLQRGQTSVPWCKKGRLCVWVLSAHSGKGSSTCRRY